MGEYVSKATVKEISATSRVSLKIRDNFYTVEYAETRTLPETDDVDIQAEQDILFDSVNAVVDSQAEDIINMFKKK